MEARLMYAGEFLQAEKGLQSGTYHIGRGSRDSLKIVGPSFGNEGMLFGGPDQTVSRLRIDDGGRVVKSQLSMEVNGQEVTLKDGPSTNSNKLDGVEFTERTVDRPGNYELKMGLSRCELVLSR
ncbi:MAG: hypothetical protein ABH864_03300 [archaeon]